VQYLQCGKPQILDRRDQVASGLVGSYDEYWAQDTKDGHPAALIPKAAPDRESYLIPMIMCLYPTQQQQVDLDRGKTLRVQKRYYNRCRMMRCSILTMKQHCWAPYHTNVSEVGMESVNARNENR
jgi:hypothetical protein